MMLDPDYIKTLKIIHERFKNLKMKWILVGNVSLT